MSKWNTEQIDSDKRILFIILLTLFTSLLVWTCILVYDIKRDVNQIKKSLLEIEEILEPIEHIDDTAGLIQHMNSETNISTEANQ